MNNINTTTTSNNYSVSVSAKPTTGTPSASSHSTSTSTTSSPVNEFQSTNENFSFQDFISAIINESDIEWHKLIVQDLERIMELKVREFKRQYQSQCKQSLSVPAGLLAKVSRDIFTASLDEPNGILGARINVKLHCHDGRLVEVARFAYDPCTLTTFEVFVIIKEDVRSIKKILSAFKLYANFGRYLATHIDENNYEIVKRRLY
jgi:hypothetical protein